MSPRESIAGGRPITPDAAWRALSSGKRSHWLATRTPAKPEARVGLARGTCRPLERPNSVPESYLTTFNVNSDGTPLRRFSSHVRLTQTPTAIF